MDTEKILKDSLNSYIEVKAGSSCKYGTECHAYGKTYDAFQSEGQTLLAVIEMRKAIEAGIAKGDSKLLHIADTFAEIEAQRKALDELYRLTQKRAAKYLTGKEDVPSLMSYVCQTYREDDQKAERERALLLESQAEVKALIKSYFMTDDWEHDTDGYRRDYSSDYCQEALITMQYNKEDR